MPPSTDAAWLYTLKDRVPSFLDELRGHKRPGFYHYALSGDFFGESVKWGLGNAVFYLKIIYTLGLEKEHEEHVRDAVTFIKGFQKSDGSFYDPLVSTLAVPSKLYHFVRTVDPGILSSAPTHRAETRQSLSSLAMLGEHPTYRYRDFPQNSDAIERYLSRQDWRVPWAAGSHFSHLLFFLQHSDLPNKAELVESAVAWIQKLQHESDGCWYEGEPDVRQRVNGAMKVITGLNAAGCLRFDYPDRLVEFCLSAKNDEGACDNFNVVYTLHKAMSLSNGEFDKADAKGFLLDRLEMYRQQYYPDIGGFSFLPGRAGLSYYGARLGRGRAEPDIHGTVMFLWGISIIAQMLGIESELGFKEFVT